MKIILNGQSHSIDTETTLDQLLTSLNLDGKPVVAELNEQAVLPRDFPATSIRDGDKLELVTLAAGG